MIPLYARPARTRLRDPLRRPVWLLVGSDTHAAERNGRAYLVENGEEPPDGFSLYITKTGAQLGARHNWIELPPELDYLTPGDILALPNDGSKIRVLWRHRSSQNSVLLTERCDNFCLMCSQPPKRANDDWLLEQALELIRLLPPETEQIGFTGGEPTYYGERLIELLALCKTLIPDAGVHTLSNGRRFADPSFAAAYAEIDNPHMMVGIPVYAAEPSLHDYVVQAQGAFDDTINGILNLARLNQRIEIRIVIHKQTAPALLEIAEFITRNIPFVEQVALMGLETIGFARANLDDVWIDPTEYAPALTEAALLLDRAEIRTMIYNHQLCLIEQRAWPYTVKSISDWKNEYHPECQSCAMIDACGGFFHAAKYRTSHHIRAFSADPSRLAQESLTS